MPKRSSLFLVVLLIGAITVAQERPSNDAVAVVGARVYTNPDAPVLSDATVVVVGGQIKAVGERQSIRIPASTRVIDGSGSVSVQGGVDVPVHVTELIERWSPDWLARAVKQNMALVPTLKLLAGMQATTKQTNLLRQVREYRAAGGEILFGTDVGFIPDYDPEEHPWAANDARASRNRETAAG